MNMADKLEKIFSIDSRLERVSDVGMSLNQWCRQHGMDEMACYQVQTAVTEAINNAILHAYANQPGNTIEVRCTLTSEKLCIEVIDQGIGMQKLPADVEPSADAESGRGWWIMRRWMDGVSYSSEQGVNRLLLHKAL